MPLTPPDEQRRLLERIIQLQEQLIEAERAYVSFMARKN